MTRKNVIQPIGEKQGLAGAKREQEAAFYGQWLSRRNEPSPIDTAATVSPREVLQAMGAMVLRDEMGDIPVLERVVAKMYRMAMDGDKDMIKKVYDELEHEGVQRVQHTHKEVLTEAQYEILESAGFIEAEYTIESHERGAQAQEDNIGTQPTENIENAPCEAPTASGGFFDLDER